jgi:DNA (cytosine-5)-methyltransferase 1
LPGKGDTLHMGLYSRAFVGGFDLASQWMGWDNVFHCELNEFGQKILKYYWPNAISYGDITKTDFTIHRGTIDILTGGFPCQPYSLAGKRKGKEDERHLWPEMLRAIREIQPSWIVGENVPGIINWSGGLVFHEVQTDLEAEGYEVFPVVLPACSTNSPHRRDRMWLIAHTNGVRWETIRTENDNIKKCNIQNNKWSSVYMGSCFTLFDEKREGLYESGICGTDDGISKRVDRLKALGNAIVPQIALQIFKAIEEYSRNKM